jgi:hypothetical protein
LGENLGGLTVATRRLKTLKPGRTEAQVLAAVLDALHIFVVDADRQNTGAAVNPSGRLVMFGRPGNADVSGMIPAGWGAASGKKLDIEVKRERFRPERLRGAKREHFERQLARLRQTNENGGYGFWCTDAAQVIHALERIRVGWRIAFDGDYPVLTDEPPGTEGPSP